MRTLEDYLSGKLKPSDEELEKMGTLHFKTVQPAITFTVEYSTEPVLMFCVNGDIYVRGEKVDSNHHVYEAMCEFLQDNGYLDNWKR